MEGKRDTLVHEVLGANQHHLDGLPVPRPMGLGDKSLLVITCMDPRLTALLPAAMGVAPEEMIQVRNAGVRALNPEGDPVRSAVAVLVLDLADEIFIIGHTDCRMVRSSTADILNGMKKRGLRREAFGRRDIRTWFGLVASERTNAIETAKVVRESPLLPPGTPVHAMLVDTATGRLEMLEDGYSRAAAAMPDAPGASGPSSSFKPIQSAWTPEPAAGFKGRGSMTPLPDISRPSSPGAVPPREARPEPPPPPPAPVLEDVPAPAPRRKPRTSPEPPPPPPPPPKPAKTEKLRLDPAPKPKSRKKSEPDSPFERAEDVLARLMKRRKR